MWLVIWNKEVVDEFDTEREALTAAREYAMAFKYDGDVTVVYRQED